MVAMEPTTVEQLHSENNALQVKIAELSAINKIALMLGTSLEFEEFLDQFIVAIQDTVHCDRVLILVQDDVRSMKAVKGLLETAPLFLMNCPDCSSITPTTRK